MKICEFQEKVSGWPRRFRTPARLSLRLPVGVTGGRRLPGAAQERLQLIRTDLIPAHQHDYVAKRLRAFGAEAFLFCVNQFPFPVRARLVHALAPVLSWEEARQPAPAPLTKLPITQIHCPVSATSASRSSRACEAPPASAAVAVSRQRCAGQSAGTVKVER